MSRSSLQRGEAVGIFLFKYYLGVSVSVVETAKYLARKGHPVTIFIDEPSEAAAPIEFADCGIEVVSIPNPCAPPSAGGVARIRRLLKKGFLAVAAWQRWHLPQMGCLGSLNLFLDAYTPLLGAYLEEVRRRIGTRRFAMLIGIEALGLITACHIRDKLGAPGARVIYYNLELILHTRGSAIGVHILKHAEILASHLCDLTVLPDEHRGRVFQEANRIPEDRVRYLPVGTGGEAIRTRTEYWRARFPISADARIVLCAGNIQQPWTMTREIVESISSWPADCVLVLHTWRENALEDPYLQDVACRADARRVFFSTRPVPPDQVPVLLAAADVGLAFYVPQDANFQEVGASSNKLAQYARVGLPVIANHQPSIERVLSHYGSGVAVADTAEIGDALVRIFDHYEDFRQGAFASYHGLYDIASHLHALYPFLVGKE